MEVFFASRPGLLEWRILTIRSHHEQDRSDTVLTLRSEKFDLKFSRPLAINYDGELHDREVEDIRYSIYSRRLRVIVGRDFIG